MSVQTQRVTFENFVFKIPPKLLFEKDGNERMGEYLFVHDSGERCLISFESGMQCFDLILREKKALCSEEYSGRQMKVTLCYPEKPAEARGYMVYFHAELLDSSGSPHILPGQMNVAAGNVWSAEPRNLLLELLKGVEVSNIKSAC